MCERKCQHPLNACVHGKVQREMNAIVGGSVPETTAQRKSCSKTPLSNRCMWFLLIEQSGRVRCPNYLHIQLCGENKQLHNPTIKHFSTSANKRFATEHSLSRDPHLFFFSRNVLQSEEGIPGIQFLGQRVAKAICFLSLCQLTQTDYSVFNWLA